MSYNYRKDNRTDEKFEQDIKIGHQKEEIYAQCIAVELEKQYGYKCIVSDIGVDNSGKVINGRLKSHNVDKLFVCGDQERRVEIKTAPHTKFFTFKVSSLNSCIAHKAHILVCLPDEYYVLPLVHIKYILDHYKPQEYYKFAPGKPSIRLQRADIDKIFLRKEWSDKSLKIIKKNKKILDYRQN